KGRPPVCVPSLRYGQPAVLASSGVSLELASLKQSRALIRWPLRSSAHPEGNPATRAIATLGLQRAGAARRESEAERSDGPSPLPSPLAAPAAGRLRGGVCRRTHASCSDSL